MFSAAIILFREVLEMSLVIGVLFAVTAPFPPARRWIYLGASLGLLGSLLVAVFMDALESSFSGDGEFLFNALLLLAASLTIAWTLVWMHRNVQAMTAKLRRIGTSVVAGDMPGMALCVATFAAVVREGGEAVLFLFSAAQAGEADGLAVLTGGMFGVMAGAMLGFALYRGMLRLPLRSMFNVLAWLMMLLAAGMVSQAVWNLVIIDYLPPLVDTLWDTSGWLPQSSLFGELFHALVGYDEQPSGMQVLAFVASFLAMALWLRFSGRNVREGRGRGATISP